MSFRTVTTPLGELGLVGDGAAVTQVLWPVQVVGVGGRTDAVLDHAATQLGEYFAGRRREFSVPLAASGTPWQQQVWAGLLEIPFGETRSYGQLACALGRPTSSRAVGAANGKNPVPVLIPCHRVIASNGSLSGFSGGVEAKEFLLRLEGYSRS